MFVSIGTRGMKINRAAFPYKASLIAYDVFIMCLILVTEYYD